MTTHTNPVSDLAYASRGRSIEATANELGVSRPTVNRLLADGKLLAKKCGAKTIVTAESIDAFWRSLPPAKFRAPSNKAT